MAPTSHNLDVPYIKRTDYQLLDIDAEGFLSLMNKEGTMKEDVKLNENDEDHIKLRDAFEEGKELDVTIMEAMDQEGIQTWKEAPKK